MENNNQPAFPIHPYKELEMDIERGYPFGLTKREYFAALAMQGLLSSNNVDPFGDTKAVADQSVTAADALLSALNPKPQ